MHERSLVQSLLRQVEDLMESNGAQRAVEINVSIGLFAGVERVLFETAFDDMVAKSSARGAQLNVREIPLEARCDACARAFDIVGFKVHCQHCGSKNVNIVRGEELILDNLVVEQASE